RHRTQQSTKGAARSMGKKHRNRDKPASSKSQAKKGRNGNDAGDDAANPPIDDDQRNPLYTKQNVFLKSLSPTERDFFFSESHVSPERRAEIWMQQADVGEDMVNRYAWATPNESCIKIFREFSPIIEMGCGRNAYWANVMKRMGDDVDVVAYDSNVQAGGVIGGSTGKKKKKTKDKLQNESPATAVVVRHGGPKVLELPENQNRTLFLCYPDEEDGEPQEGDDDDDDVSGKL
ncbi:MAG: hypothetical protein SGARI_004559, partial [Bacillariaceae sp.]